MPTATSSLSQKRHILCIDDYQPGLEVRAMLLDRWGYSVTNAATGEEGLAVMERCHVDLVILDYKMPAMDGAEVAQIVKARWPDVLIIMLSGWPRVPAVAKTCTDALVEKGGRTERLRSVLVGLLDGEPLSVRATLARTRQLFGIARQSLSRTRRTLWARRQNREHKCG